MNAGIPVVVWSLWFALCIGAAPSAGAGKSKWSTDLTDPYIAWADGQEVEIRFRLSKFKAIGLTVADLDSVKSMRFWGENWTRTINDVKVDVKQVADLKFRALQAPPFAVKLLDGREALIKPLAKKLSRYMVTGEYFQAEVVRRLDDPHTDDPLKVTVLRGLICAGDLPHATGPDKIHRSLGEPLGEFAHIEFRGKPGPQAAELARMRVAYDTVHEAMGYSRGMARAVVDKRFGPGKPSDPKTPERAQTYILQNGTIEVHWTREKTIDYAYALYGKDLPTAKADEPEKLARQARELADAYRALTLEYLSKMRETMTPAERKWISGLLDRSQPQLRWTDAERRLVLGALEAPKNPRE